MANTKILVVEDYDDARRLIKHALEEKGFDVIEATDGYEAVEITMEDSPDLILMDMALPGMDGLAAARRIKKMDEGVEIPIIGITAHGNFYNQKALDAGCEVIINKPIDVDNLKKLVSEYLH